MDKDEDTFEVDLPDDNFELPDEFRDAERFKVYLASALTGIEKTKSEYDAKIRSVISEALTKSRYCGLGYDVYDPGENTPPGSMHSAEQVYVRDFEKTIESDLVVFYLNRGSLGMGEEAQIAAGATIPKVVIYKQGENVSRMFDGIFNPTLFTVAFSSVGDLEQQLSHAIAVNGANLLEAAVKRRRILKDAMNHKLPKFIFKRRVYLNLTIDVLAEQTGIAAYWLTEIQRDQQGRKAAMLTWIQLQRIKQTLDAVLDLKEDGRIALKPRDEDRLFESADQALESFYDAYAGRERVTDDEVILSVWNEYLRQKKDSTEPLLAESHVVTEGEWLERFQDQEKDTLAQTLGINIEKMSPIMKESFESLWQFRESAGHLDKTIVSKLWDDFSKHVERPKRAAREGRENPKPYTIKDWREAFDGLTLND